MMPLCPHATPHDTLFKKALQRPEVVQQFLQYYLPVVRCELIDFSTLSMESAEFIDDDFRKTVCDVVVSFRMKHDKTGYIYVLLEHQRKAEPMMPFRLLKYVVRVMERYLQAYRTRVLPLVFPFVVYNGSRTYPYANCLTDLFPNNFHMQGLYPLRSDCFFVDLYSEDMHAVANYFWIAPVLKSLKYGPSKIKSKQLISEISLCLVRLAEQKEIGYIEDILRYLYEVRGSASRSWLQRELMRILEPKLGEKTVLSIADFLRNEGRKEERQKARQEARQEVRQHQVKMVKGMLQAGLSKEQVAKIADLNLEELQLMVVSS